MAPRAGARLCAFLATASFGAAAPWQKCKPCDFPGAVCGPHSCCTQPGTSCGHHSVCSGTGTTCGHHSECTGTGSTCGKKSTCTGTGTTCGPKSTCRGPGTVCFGEPAPGVGLPFIGGEPGGPAGLAGGPPGLAGGLPPFQVPGTMSRAPPPPHGPPMPGQLPPGTSKIIKSAVNDALQEQREALREADESQKQAIHAAMAREAKQLAAVEAAQDEAIKQAQAAESVVADRLGLPPVPPSGPHAAGAPVAGEDSKAGARLGLPPVPLGPGPVLIDGISAAKDHGGTPARGGGEAGAAGAGAATVPPPAAHAGEAKASHHRNPAGGEESGSGFEVDTHWVVLAALVLPIVAGAGALLLRHWGPGKQAGRHLSEAACGPERLCMGPDPEEGNGFDADAEQALRGAYRPEELKGLLADLEREVPDLAALPPPGQAALPPPDASQRAMAKREVERILSAASQRDVLRGGTPAERRSDFRRLALMLHPDKGLVSGERAGLALRRVVEAHRAEGDGL